MRKFNYISLDFKLNAAVFVIWSFLLMGFELYKAFFLQDYYMPYVGLDKLPTTVRYIEFFYMLWSLYALNLPRTLSLFFLILVGLSRSFLPMTLVVHIADSFISCFLIMKVLADNAFYLRSFNPEEVESPYKKEEGNDDSPIEFK